MISGFFRREHKEDADILYLKNRLRIRVTGLEEAVLIDVLNTQEQDPFLEAQYRAQNIGKGGLWRKAGEDYTYLPPSRIHEIVIEDVDGEKLVKARAS